MQTEVSPPFVPDKHTSPQKLRAKGWRHLAPPPASQGWFWRAPDGRIWRQSLGGTWDLAGPKAQEFYSTGGWCGPTTEKDYA